MRVTLDETNRSTYAWAVEATVQIQRRLKNQRGFYTTGTGFVISDDGVIVTAQHVVARARTVVIKLMTLSKKGWRIWTHGRYVADVVFRDHRADIALLKMRKVPRDHTVMSIGDSDRVGVGLPLFRIGCDEDSRRISEGYVFAAHRFDFSKLPRFDVSMPSRVGGSGGPLLMLDGTVVGVAIHFAATPGQPPWVGMLPMNVVRQRLAWRKEVKALFAAGEWPETKIT